mmetsp:Transcript_1074/g.2712  ORF Transcript_1074/g.2712 Transcript_1074/m.2712 type:complete len:127 (+) Transcript_1074:50-430(+)
MARGLAVLCLVVNAVAGLHMVSMPKQAKSFEPSCVCGSGEPFGLCCGSSKRVEDSCPCGSGVPYELCCGGLGVKDILEMASSTGLPARLAGDAKAMEPSCPCGSGVPFELCCGAASRAGPKATVVA